MEQVKVLLGILVGWFLVEGIKFLFRRYWKPFHAWRERRARERYERSLQRCPACQTTKLICTGGSIWGFVGYLCENGHRFDIDVL
jgi:hypothetical protein